MINDLISKKETAKSPKVRSVQTLFRNAARSNLELTQLADTKASILISLNGFILTVIITASGLQLNDELMVYPFISVILTALITIFCGIKAIQPRYKEQFISKKYLGDEKSILYFQDAVSLSPKEYLQESLEVIQSSDETHKNIINHLHILSSEIKVKYCWLRYTYVTFTLGLSLSVLLVIYSLLNLK